MPWMTLARLLSILRRNRIDPRRVEVYVETEAIEPRLRDPQRERLEPEQDMKYDDGGYDDEEDKY